MHFIGIAIEPSPLYLGFGAWPVDRTHTPSGILKNTPLQALAILKIKLYRLEHFNESIYDRIYHITPLKEL